MANRSILLIDDDPDSADLVEHALRTVPGCAEVQRFHDGSGAAAWYRGPHVTNDVPACALYDAHRSERSGLGGIGTLRAVPALRMLPIVVLADVIDANAIAAAYRHGANSVVQKPFDPLELRTAVQQVASYWLLRNMAA